MAFVTRACLAAVLVGGCSGVSPIGASIAPYSASNALQPFGYSETKVADGHYQVTASGTETTPKARIEKIARARAAQIGVEQKLAYFKVTNVQYGFKCRKRQQGYKSQASPASSRPMVVLDVVYAKDAADPTYAPSAQTFEALNAELAGEVVPADASAAAAEETRAGCGPG
jgi:hypothetical protein